MAGKRYRRRWSNGSKQGSPPTASKRQKQKNENQRGNSLGNNNNISGPAASVISEGGTAENISEMDGFGDVGPADDVVVDDPAQQDRPTKIPPVMVKNVSLDRLKQEVKASGINAQFKLTRMGIKIVVQTIPALTATTKCLTRMKAEYYTHDIAEEKPFKAVIRGLPIMEKEAIKAELTERYKLQPVAIHVIARKISEGDYRDCLYLVHFRKGSTSLNALKAVRSLNDMIVSWELYRGSHRDVTQCMRCLNFGHGTRNCSLKPRCNICAHPHLSSDCLHEEVVAFKCVNCGGAHKASDKICPKREHYKQIRKDAATRNLPGRRAPDDRQLFSQEDFPAIHPAINQHQQQPVPPSWPRQGVANAASDTRHRPSVNHHQHRPAPSWNGHSQRSTSPKAPPRSTEPQVSANTPSGATDESPPLYSPEELVRIFLDMSDKLKRCRSRHEQVETLGVFLIQYGQ